MKSSYSVLALELELQSQLTFYCTLGECLITAFLFTKCACLFCTQDSCVTRLQSGVWIFVPALSRFPIYLPRQIGASSGTRRSAG